MPFTLAHPAAAIPLCRPLGRYAVLSALVIGSIVPDLWYLLPIGVYRADSHSVEGIFRFCLPVALASYLLFHGLLKRALLALVPQPLALRLATATDLRSVLPRASWLAVLASLLAGIVTHLAWDSLTHYDGGAAEAFPALRVELFSIGRYDVHAFSVLQYGSSLLGMALVAYWFVRWLRRAPCRSTALPFALSGSGRVMVGLLLMAMAVWGAVSPWVQVPPQTQAGSLGLTRALVRTHIAGAGSAFCAGLLLYGALWTAFAWRKGAAPPFSAPS
jgi:hypothetical protein